MLVAFLLVGTALCAAPAAAFACKCKGPRRPTRTAVARAAAAFRGTIVKLRYDEGRRGSFRKSRWYKPIPTTAVLKVSAVYKGKVHAVEEVSLGLKSCSLRNVHRKRLRVGEQWVIVARRRNKRLYTHQCHGSRPAALAKKSLRRLGKGSLPLPGRAKHAGGR
jgi:hypothetical protein